MRPLIRAAFVIARRDSAATVFSRSFLLFLLGPLFPIVIGMIFGGIGGTMASDAERPVVAVLWSKSDYESLAGSRKALHEAVGFAGIIELRHEPPASDARAQRDRVLASTKPPVIGVLEGSLDRPRLVGAAGEDSGTARQLRLLIQNARELRTGEAPTGVGLQVTKIPKSAGSMAGARAITARAGQMLLFLLTFILATLLLSQLIEEKSNKIIEVLAAAVPVDAIFLGKLFAMLAMSLLGIAIWSAAGAAAIALLVDKGLSVLPAPSVGWPLFGLLALIYFSMSYLLLGAVFLGIGAQASTAREVQTLSMPVTMAQVAIFAIASTTVGYPDSGRTIAAALFPLSSPFVMIARAAESPALWPHLAAIAWQTIWVALILAFASRLFRRNVLKSGPVRRRWWRRARA